MGLRMCMVAIYVVEDVAFRGLRKCDDYGEQHSLHEYTAEIQISNKAVLTLAHLA